MAQEKQKISVKFEQKEPVAIEKHYKPPKSKNPFKRYYKIEEVAGRPVEEILLENLQLRNRRNDMGFQIKSLNDKINKVNNILHQLLDVELTMNPEIAKPIAEEFDVNKYNEDRRGNLESVEIVAEALRKIRYYYHPSLQEWVEVVKKAEQKTDYYETRHEQMEKQLEQYKQKIEELQIVKETQSVKKIPSKGVRIVIGEKGKKQESLATKEEVKQNETKEEIVMPTVVVTEKESTEKVASVEPALETEKHAEKNPIVERNEVIEEKPRKQTEKVTAKVKSSPSYQESKKEEETKSEITYYEPNQPNLMDEIQKPKYIMLLDRKGYEYKQSEQPQYDLMIQRRGEHVPLIYIDYNVTQAEIFDEMMKQTDNIYFLFDTRENMKTGNAKFASWLLRSKEKRKRVKFSFTTMDELKVSGLDELDSL